MIPEGRMQPGITEPCHEIFPPLVAARKTFCVLGVPRGGTTMVAGLLVRMGIFMGSDVVLEFVEDREFLGHRGHRDLFENLRRESEKISYLSGVNDVIDRRNKEHEVWGWKDPISIFYLLEIARRLVNPHYIFVTRDLGAVARNEMLVEAGPYPPEHILAHMLVAAQATSRICAFLAGERKPALMISYERSLTAPDRMVSSLARFVGAGPVDDELVSFVKPVRRP